MTEYESHKHPVGRDARFVGYAPMTRRSEPHLTRADRRAYVDALAGHTVFAECSREDLAALVSASNPFNYPANWAVVTENTPSDNCYVVLKGQATVYRDRRPIAAIEPGAVIGEMSVLTGSLRRATVTTTTRMTGLYVDNDKLIKLLHARPSLLASLRSIFASRAHATGREFEPAALPARHALGLSFG